MKEKLYYLVLDSEEHSLMLRGLDALKEDIKNGEGMEDCVKAINEIIVKVGKAPTRKFKVIKRED